jgi:hypothetical protein
MNKLNLDKVAQPKNDKKKKKKYISYKSNGA